jgi:membrane protein YqaA with SNARE-associated domain
MFPAAATILASNPTAAATAAILAQAAARSGARSNPFLHFLFHFGVYGLLVVSTVDSSFVPLPIPGMTDIMLIVLAAQHANWFLLILLATFGSAFGGYVSYRVGNSGGLAFLEKRVSTRTFRSITGWMEHHAILAVALPAILPPPMPLSLFVLAAGALNMPRKQFLTTFTISRAIRHTIAVWLGVHYGRHILRVWNLFSAKWSTTILAVLWSVILISCGYAIWKLYKTSRGLGTEPRLSTPKAPA